MADYKQQLLLDVTGALVNKLDPADIEIVSDEMTIALSEYDVTKPTTELVVYEGFNEELLNRYKACLMLGGKSPKTIYAYERAIKKLFEALQKNFMDMTVTDLRCFLAYEKSRGVSNRTLDNTRAQISAFFAWLVEEELIFKNPCASIAPIKYPKVVRLPFSSVEIDALRSACVTKKERALMEMLLSSGVRVSELCSITLSDIDFNTLTITVREGKGAKQRIVCINELACKHLVEYLTTRDVNGEYLFYNKWKEAMAPGGVRHILNKLGDRAGVSNVHPHRFRRTFATGLANRGMEIQEIGKLLGHANLNTTLEYIYTSDEKIRASYLRYIA